MEHTSAQTAATPAKQGGSTALKLFFALSGAAMTLLLSQGGSLLFIGAGVFLSLVVCLVLAFRFDLPQTALASKSPLALICGAVLAFSVALFYRPVFAATAEEVIVPFLEASPLSFLAGAASAALPVLVCLCALFALFVWFYLFCDWAVRFARRWLAGSCRAERLFVLIGTALAIVAITLAYNSTSAFYGAKPYDVVYTTDSGNLISTNAYLFVNAYENDIRQPMFAVFSMPFSAVAMLLSKLLFFVPHAYALALASLQALLMLFCFTLLARVLKLQGADRLVFLLLLAVSYPTLLFALAFEQYAFSVFWVIVLLYAWQEKEEPRTMLFVAASGSLLTSGAFFPLLFDEKNAPKRLRALVSAGLSFLAVFILFGRVPLLNRAVETARDISSFAGGVGFAARALQYLSFVSACFARPAAGIDLAAYAHASYQMHAATSINWPGFTLLLLAAVSAVLYRKDARMRVFSLWAGFSLVLLFLIGWGASENGMVLYTLYFFWAFAALLYMLFQRVLSRRPKLRAGLAALAVAALACVNTLGIIDLIRFGMRYYPIV